MDGHRRRAWKWFEEVMGTPRYWVAPMVNASEYAFRCATQVLATLVRVRALYEEPKVRFIPSLSTGVSQRRTVPRAHTRRCSIQRPSPSLTPTDNSSSSLMHTSAPQ